MIAFGGLTTDGRLSPIGRDSIGMAQAQTYSEWARAAQAADRIDGRGAWRDIEISARYDHRTIRFGSTSCAT